MILAPPPTQFAKQVLQGCRAQRGRNSDSPESRKNLRYGAPLARCDAVVEIFKDPIQPLSEDTAHTGFPGSHETDQKNSVVRKIAGPVDDRLGRTRVRGVAFAVFPEAFVKS